MKLRLGRVAVGSFTLLIAGAAPGSALAGGLFLPGNGAVSTARAGAATASASDGEALAANPSGLASAPKGSTFTISMAMIQYAMQFTRAGSYDSINETDQPYENQPFGTVENDPAPPLGIGKLQPVPVVAFITDLGGAVPGLHAAVGIYAPNAYPFRRMGADYQFFASPGVAPPPTRYDIVEQEAAVLFPSLAAGYRVNDKFDIGARVSWGFADLKSTTTIWGITNYSEYIENDGIITLEAKDSFVPAFGLGATYHATPDLDIAVNYNSWAPVRAQGQVTSKNGSGVVLGTEPIVVDATDPYVNEGFRIRCAAGGTSTAQKACVDLDLPMNAQLGARYKFKGADGKMRGDIELDLDWENWSSDRVSNYRVVVDAIATVNGMATIDLKDTYIHHGFKDTLGARLGGSYVIPVNSESDVVVRGGVGYDTAAAKTGWLRADVDGAARTTLTVGAGYKAKSWEINIGGGAILEGSPTNPNSGPNGEVCNPAGTVNPPALGCDGTGQETPVGSRNGVDPTNPAINDNVQAQSPVNQGVYKSHYILAMLGFTMSF